MIYKEYGAAAKAEWAYLTLDRTEIRGLNLDYETGSRELADNGIFCIIDPHKILSVALSPWERKCLSIWIVTEDK